MEHRRTTVFVALLLLSPLTIALPFMSALKAPATNTYTSMEEETLTYASTATQTYYGSTTGTALVQAPLDLPAKVVGFMTPKGKCSQYTYAVTVHSGSILNIEVTSTNPANLYLLPTYTYQTSANGCELTAPTNELAFQGNFTEYTLRWTAPEGGTFYIILTGPTTVIMLEDAGSSQPVKELANMTYAMSTETSFQNYAVKNQSVLTFTTTSNQPLDLQQPPTLLGLEFLTLFGLVVCLAITGIDVAKGRSK
jgi:hypothetical protein